VRIPLVVANWKMHKTAREARAFCEALRVADGRVEPAVAPPFPALAAAAEALAARGIALAAQNVHPEAEGAFTGEVSAGMLADLGCRYVIVGHSERRALFGESSEQVARKVLAVQRAGMVPIVCVGETLAERESGRAASVIEQQLRTSTQTAHADAPERLVVAYEPVWAIGTGRTATPAMAQEIHALLRGALGKRFGAGAASIRIQYGGSVKPENAGALAREPDIDGALVGSASLDPGSFSAIIRAVAAAAAEESPA
jgi:triosephosphate isomerase